MSYSHLPFQNNPGVNIKGSTIAFPKQSSGNQKYVFFTNYKTTSGKLGIYGTKHDDFTDVGGESVNNLLLMKEVDFHSCKTNPLSGNGDIYIPFFYYGFSKNNRFILFTTAKSTGSAPCKDSYGKLWIFQLDFTNLVLNDAAYPTDIQGKNDFFHNPNTLGLGLASFSGYTKVVHSTGNLNLFLVLVFYEHT